MKYEKIWDRSWFLEEFPASSPYHIRRNGCNDVGKWIPPFRVAIWPINMGSPDVKGLLFFSSPAVPIDHTMLLDEQIPRLQLNVDFLIRTRPRMPFSTLTRIGLDPVVNLCQCRWTMLTASRILIVSKWLYWIAWRSGDVIWLLIGQWWSKFHNKSYLGVDISRSPSL